MRVWLLSVSATMKVTIKTDWSSPVYSTTDAVRNIFEGDALNRFSECFSL